MEASNNIISAPNADTDQKKQILTRQAVSFAKSIARDGVKGLPKNIVARAINIGAMNSDPGVRDPQKYKEDLLKMASVQLDSYSTWESLTERYGKSWYDWEPETVWQTLYHDYAHEPDRNAKDMILGLQTLCSTDFAFEDWHIFEKTVHALNMNHVSFEHVQVAELDEIAYAINVMKKIRPKNEFDSEVLGYIASSARHCGVVFLPEDLFPKGCQEILDTNNNQDLVDAVRRAQGKAIKYDTETPLGVQLARLDEIREAARLD